MQQKHEGPRVPSYKLVFSENERALIHPLIAAMRLKERGLIQSAAKQFAIEQYGISPDAAMLDLPSWMTDDLLRNPRVYKQEFSDTFILFVPRSDQISKNPESEVCRWLKADDKSHWVQVRYDTVGIPEIGIELTNALVGTLPEHQHSPNEIFQPGTDFSKS